MLFLKPISVLFWILVNVYGLLAQSQSDFPSTVDTQILSYATPYCGSSDPEVLCNIPCYEDPKCQNLGYNISIYSCACPDQYCSDGKVYGPEAYNSGPPLTDEELKDSVHVKAACNGYVPAEIAPYHIQIGTPPSNDSSS